MRFVIVFLSLCIADHLSAQTPARITYEEKFDLHRNLPPERQEMKEMIPQFNSAFFEFYYTDSTSVYQAQKVAEETEMSASSTGTRMTMRFGRENRVVYKNLAHDKMVDSRDFMQKQFLIKGPPTIRKWKIGTGKKEIMGFTCMEANFRIDSANAITAWFTPQISVSNGPADYQGLPGMILQVDLNEGERTITATKMYTENVETTDIVAPMKGKEVTSEEFEKIREEKMKEMHLQQPSGHRMMIRQH